MRTDVPSRQDLVQAMVQHLDGPKNPRSFDGFPTLTAAIVTFQRTLRALALAHAIDLDAAVDAKVTATVERDRGRFGVVYDPSTADSLRAFRAGIPAGSALSAVARLWGALVQPS